MHVQSERRVLLTPCMPNLETTHAQSPHSLTSMERRHRWWGQQRQIKRAAWWSGLRGPQTWRRGLVKVRGLDCPGRLPFGISRVECQVTSNHREQVGSAALLESRWSLKFSHAPRVSPPRTGRAAHHRGIAQCRVNLILMTEHLKTALFFKRLFCEQLLHHNFAFALNESQCHLYSFARSCILSAWATMETPCRWVCRALRLRDFPLQSTGG